MSGQHDQWAPNRPFQSVWSLWVAALLLAGCVDAPPIGVADGPDSTMAEPRREGSQAGDCTDRADNDEDGKFDCDDDGCARSPDCPPRPADMGPDRDAARPAVDQGAGTSTDALPLGPDVEVEQGGERVADLGVEQGADEGLDQGLDDMRDEGLDQGLDEGTDAGLDEDAGDAESPPDGATDGLISPAPRGPENQVGLRRMCAEREAERQARVDNDFVADRCSPFHEANDEETPWWPGFECSHAGNGNNLADLRPRTLLQESWCYRSLDESCCYCLRDFVRLVLEQEEACPGSNKPLFEILETRPHITGFLPTTSALEEWACDGPPEVLDTPICTLANAHLVRGVYSPQDLTELAASDRPFVFTLGQTHRPIERLEEEQGRIRVDRTGILIGHSAFLSILGPDGGHVHWIDTVLNLDFDDDDNDGWQDEDDNCDHRPNEDQRDADGDGTGCDAFDDSDGDGLDDDLDNCPLLDTPNRNDADGDGVGDACDNCPRVVNPHQEDDDEDDYGNVCDHCPAGYRNLGRSCYAIPLNGQGVPIRRSQSQARSHCKNEKVDLPGERRSGHLVTLLTQEEAAFTEQMAVEYADENNIPLTVHLGLKRARGVDPWDTAKWLTGEAVIDLGRSLVPGGEGNASYFQQQWLENQGGFYWPSVNSNSLRAFICEFDVGDDDDD